MRKALSAVAALSCLLFVAPAQAAIDRTNLDQFNIGIWKVRTAFHTYSVMMGDPRYQESLEEAIYDTADLVDTMAQNAEGDAEVELMAELEPMWQDYQRLAESNTIAELGYTDRYTVLDLDTLAVRMHELLEPQRADTSGEGEDLLMLASKIQRIASEYMAIAASPDGGGTVGTSEARLEFNVAVPEFDKMLEASRARYADQELVSRTLDQVASKWNFMRESLIKFNENSVPFVVNRYTNSIVENLSFTADTMGMEDVAPPPIPGL